MLSYGARGGAGASTVAAHLAQILAGRSEQRTALVDLALPFGGLATSLKVDFDRDAAARIYSPSTIDMDVLNRMSYKVAGNLWLVPCPPDVGGELTDNTQGRKALMHLLRAEFRASSSICRATGRGPRATRWNMPSTSCWWSRATMPAS